VFRFVWSLSLSSVLENPQKPNTVDLGIFESLMANCLEKADFYVLIKIFVMRDQSPSSEDCPDGDYEQID